MTIDQPITRILISEGDGWSNTFMVGASGVTRIEATEKAGPCGDIPYVRVWHGDAVVAEFCQHNIVGVYFGPRGSNLIDSSKPPTGYCGLGAGR